MTEKYIYLQLLSLGYFVIVAQMGLKEYLSGGVQEAVRQLWSSVEK
jgi:hypothetical protein